MKTSQISGGNLKEWEVVHKIKALHDKGEGLSIRKIADELKISRNTVRKYLRMDEKQITERMENQDRSKHLDEYSMYIKHQLSTFPGLSAVKLKSRLMNKFTNIEFVSDRTIRRYAAKVKRQIPIAQIRYYEPVLDMVPGVQCQVDPGELRNVIIDGSPRTVYFVVFVLSYSRLMYVSCSLSPIDTTTFIRMHDAAFRYFGGCPEEVVYDQTKLVVIQEKYRELKLNQRMSQYAIAAGYTIRACEGFDPESKGKVEAGVKYVKRNAFYGESFRDEAEMHDYIATWLDQVANVRIHGTTGKKPVEHFLAEEKRSLKPYFSPSIVHLGGRSVTRKVDKTGLISYQSIKYSAPMSWQKQTVAVHQDGEDLVLMTPDLTEEIARHKISEKKGEIVKNHHHYRDLSATLSTLEAQVIDRLGIVHGEPLCLLLKANAPSIYKDQLIGILKIIKLLGVPDKIFMDRLVSITALTATVFEELLKAYFKDKEKNIHNIGPNIDNAIVSSIDPLACYESLTQGGQSYAFN